MGTKFDSANDSKLVSYLDANGLYVWTMSKQLPTCGFKWMTERDLEDWKHMSCILEVYLEYPKT